MKLLPALALTAALSGCVRDCERIYPILGFGFVVVNTNQPKATVVKTTIFGAGITTLPPQIVAGFSRSTAALVDTNANVTLDMK